MRRLILIILSLLVFKVLVLASCSQGSEMHDTKSDGEARDLPTFKDVMREAGIRDTTVLGQTASWADFNNDGLLDLIVANADILSRRARNLFVLLNNGDGTFGDMTKDSGIINEAIRSVGWADFNNDGFIDLLLGTGRAIAPPVLYKNEGGGSFTDISEVAGLFKEGGVTRASWVDYDNDGLVDIFQAKPFVPFLYRNQGDETFKEVSEESGLGQSSLTSSALWFDSNNDGFQDLFLVNKGSNRFYINKNGIFTDVTDLSGLGGDPKWRSVAACVGDYDGDGFLDLYVGNIGSSRNALYRNKGDGTFVDVTMKTGTHDKGDARTCSWVDFDADGKIDLYSTNHLSPSKLFRNLGKGEFRDVASEVGLDSPMDAFAAAWGDYNGDGFMDVFLNGHLGKALMENSKNSNNFVIVELSGEDGKTNRSAIGTRVEVTTPKIHQIRDVSGGHGCCEQDMLPLHFGLGKENKVDILVKWTSGKQCSFKDVSVEGGKILRVSEQRCHIEDKGV